MPTFKFAKLVRDRIVEHQISSGAVPHYRHLTTNEHKEALIVKIIEEAQEIAQANPVDIAAEIADVQQAIDDLKELSGLTSADIAHEQAIKNAKNGAFKKGHFIESVEVGEDDKWATYYRENADRYPEI